LQKETSGDLPMVGTDQPTKRNPIGNGKRGESPIPVRGGAFPGVLSRSELSGGGAVS